jgi:glycosyltransferase involved in cell wall biosynthesis
MLVEHGFPADRILTVPNSTYLTKLQKESHTGDYIGFIGRISPEKGITVLLAAARKNANIPFKVAGAHERMPHVLKEAPSNIEFLGHISNKRKDLFYRNSRVIILCSVCFESFGNTLIEAMSHGKPVVASRLAGIPEIVDHDTTGLLFETGNADDLTEKIRYLWERPELCHKMGQAGREKVLQEYSPKRYYERVLTVYEKAIRLGPGGPKHKS